MLPIVSARSSAFFRTWSAVEWPHLEMPAPHGVPQPEFNREDAAHPAPSLRSFTSSQSDLLSCGDIGGHTGNDLSTGFSAERDSSVTHTDRSSRCGSPLGLPNFLQPEGGTVSSTNSCAREGNDDGSSSGRSDAHQDSFLNEAEEGRMSVQSPVWVHRYNTVPQPLNDTTVGTSSASCATTHHFRRSASRFSDFTPQASDCAFDEYVKCEYCRVLIPLSTIASHRRSCAAAHNPTEPTSLARGESESFISSAVPVRESSPALDSGASSRSLECVDVPRQSERPQRRPFSSTENDAFTWTPFSRSACAAGREPSLRVQPSYRSSGTMGSFFSAFGPPPERPPPVSPPPVNTPESGPAADAEDAPQQNGSLCPLCGVSVPAEEEDDHQMAHRLQEEDDDVIGPFRHMYERLLQAQAQQSALARGNRSSALGITLSFGGAQAPRLVVSTGTDPLDYLRHNRSTQSTPPDRILAHPTMLEALAHQLVNQSSDASSDTPRGTPPGIIERLPIFVYRDIAANVMDTQDTDEPNSTQQMCVVCLDEYTSDDRLRRLPCLHYFHVSCIDRWLNRSLLCPSCKTPVV